MAIPPHEFLETKGQFLDLEPIHTDQDDWITAVAVTIEGIRGSGTGNRGGAPVQYRVLVDLSQLRHELPVVWVVAPEDSRIKHVNIFRANSICPFTQTKLPTLCWGHTPRAWTDVSVGGRTLPNLLEAARQVLANANLHSRAR